MFRDLLAEDSSVHGTGMDLLAMGNDTSIASRGIRASRTPSAASTTQSGSRVSSTPEVEEIVQEIEIDDSGDEPELKKPKVDESFWSTASHWYCRVCHPFLCSIGADS